MYDFLGSEILFPVRLCYYDTSGNRISQYKSSWQLIIKEFYKVFGCGDGWQYAVGGWQQTRNLKP